MNPMQVLLHTKLFVPLMPSGVILRPHLVERLNLGRAGKLSLVTAPAGYGKTTLVTAWLHQLTTRDTSPQVVWLSLDEGDNDVRRFLAYLVATLCQLDDAFLATKEAFLQDPSDEIPTEAIVTSLLNQLVAYGRPAVLVLDDYHEIEQPMIHEALSFWLDHQPPHFHLVITSRTEPPLPLPRLRVRRQVTEIEAEALRFSRTEATDFLNQHMHLSLSADNIAQLDLITEGWVAGLQLVTLSLQNKEDPSAFIQTFKGDNRYIVDYLVHEVVRRQPKQIRDFLLQTSILERFNAQLCHAVTAQTDSQHLLEQLDQARLFIIPLDDHRRWYRYHHLFADCLQAELRRVAPEKIPTYHERASRWFNQNGFFEEAIAHAFAAGNHTMATDLIVAHVGTMLWGQGGSHQLWQWIQQLPEQVVQTRPQLLITIAWLSLYLFGEYSGRIDQLLADATGLIHATPRTTIETTALVAEIALIRLTLERLRGRFEQAIAHGEQALEHLQTIDSPLLKTGALHSMALTHYQMGHIAQCLSYSDAELASRGHKPTIDHTYCVSLAYRLDALRLQGRLQQAERVWHNLASSLGTQQRVGRAMLAISWAEVLRERNQFTQAVKHLLPAINTLKPKRSMAVVVQTGAITLARIYQAQGNGPEALELLRETQQNFGASEIYYPSARLAATEALLHLRQGYLLAAQSWVERSGLRADDDPTYMLEIDYLVLAHVLLAAGDTQAARSLLEKLEQAMRDGGRTARLIEVYVLQALAHYALGEREPALSHLGQAIALAEPEGFVRVFVDEGQALVPLLKRMAGRGVAVTYIRQLLPLFDNVAQRPPPSTTNVATPDLLLNPLTERELATLRYLASTLTIPEIAEQMVVAPSTIRTYVKRIYAKLDVHTRLEAVHRARSLALLP